jgi:mRNA interferase RelE/StbE
MKRLPASVVQRILDAIYRLAADPRPHGCIKLKGFDNKYRIRVGDYRVLYEIHQKIVVVLIIEISHRKDAYR